MIGSDADAAVERDSARMENLFAQLTGRFKEPQGILQPRELLTRSCNDRDPDAKGLVKFAGIGIHSQPQDIDLTTHSYAPNTTHA